MSIPGSSSALFLAAAAAGAGGYQVERSLRFNSSDSAYLSRTPASAGNRKTWTWSGWVKKVSNGNTLHSIFAASTSGFYDGLTFGYNNSDTLGLNFANAAGNGNDYGPVFETTQVFRDVSAWYHIVLAVDTTQATAANRVKLYVNGAQITTFSTTNYPAQNYETNDFNTAQTHYLSAAGGLYAGRFFNGYLAEVHFIDGQALTPSSFAETDATTGQWVPKAFSGSYGTNGFQLKFADNSNNTATTLGKDTSGNGNNWTPTNLSVTAGAGNDSLVDTPTSYGTDDSLGGSVRGNYATLNPLSGASTHPLGNGNLEKISTSGSGNRFGTIGIISGKFYWENAFTVIGAGPVASCGISSNGRDANNISELKVYETTGTKYNGSSSSAYGASWGANDVIGIAFDADNGTLAFYKNGVSQGTAFTGLTGLTWFPVFRDDGGYSGWINFGQRPFAYTAPSGFKALCDTNLPAPVVAKPSTVMDVKLYTGNGSTQTISGLGFSPDLVWIKERNASADHALYDTVRGVQQQLESNTTTDETTESTGLTAFNSDGFALGSLAQVNTNTDTYVAWCWDESATAGFDIVTYTGNGSARTISHGLGVAPNMIIVKARTTASTDQGWTVYHSANTANPETDYLLLNSTAATADLDTVWNDTAPTSSVFSVGTNALVNVNNDTYVAYLFSAVVGYSNGFSYTGNGSTDGSFVYLGFRPRLILLKCSSTTGNWTLLDTAREGYNVDNDPLYPNLSDAEGTTDLLDITSNGFKLRTTDTSVNSSGATYIGFAWAEAPFAYSRAR